MKAQLKDWDFKAIGSWTEWPVGLVRGRELGWESTAAEGCSASEWIPTGKVSTHLPQVLKLLSLKAHSPAEEEGTHFLSCYFDWRVVLAFHFVVIRWLSVLPMKYTQFLQNQTNSFLPWKVPKHWANRLSPPIVCFKTSLQFQITAF